MKDVWQYTSRWTKLALIFCVVFAFCGALTLIVAISAKSVVQIFVVGLMGIAFLQGSLLCWRQEFLPGLFSAMCSKARSLEQEERFVCAVSPHYGETPGQTARRVGVDGLMKALQTINRNDCFR